MSLNFNLEKRKSLQDLAELALIYPLKLRWGYCLFNHRKLIVKDNKISISSTYSVSTQIVKWSSLCYFIIFLPLKTRSS